MNFRLPKICSAITVLLGLSVLVGWVFDIAVLKSVLPVQASMKANTAIGLLLAAISVELNTFSKTVLGGKVTLLVNMLALFVVLIGAVTLSEYLFGWNLGIDELFFRDPSTALAKFPGRMGPNTAVAFMLIGLALLLIDIKLWHFYPAPSLSLMVGLVGFVSIIGYLYSIGSLYGIASYTPMAVHTAVAFVFLSIAVFFLRPERGVAMVFWSPSLGGTLLRRLLFPAIFIPPAVGWLRLWGERIGLYGTEFGLALFATANVGIFTWLVLATSKTFHQTDLTKRKLEEELKQTQEQFLTKLTNDVAEKTKQLKGQRTAALSLMMDAQEDRKKIEKAEQEISEKANYLARTNEELEKFNQAAVGRELRVIQLKREINQLSKRIGNKEPYDLSIFDKEGLTDITNKKS